ncbi:MAG TPA: ATP-binding protein [Anaerolineaceae bacterium]|nr:ATP-binding protein [Anaerolineaceae bacterium]
MLADFRARQRDYLLEISRALTQELDINKLLGRILNISVEMLAGQAGLIALRSESGEWKITNANNIPTAFLKYLEPFLADIPSDPKDPESNELPEVNRLMVQLTQMASLGLLTGVGLPLIARQKVVGVIFIFRSYPDVFSPNDRSLLRSFADQAAIAVQNAQLYSQISQEKQRMDALLDSAADGIMILTPGQQIERSNPALARLLGMKVDDIQGKRHDEIVRWAKPPQGLTLESAEAGGWPLTPHAQLYVEGDLVRPKGMPPLPVGITYAPLQTESGNLINIIATVRDITRFREAEEAKSTFISVISHELKTPVALIKGYVSTLRREDARWNKAVVDDSLAVIEEEADRLALMIENLLDASRLQAGGLTLKRADVLLPETARRLAKRFETQTSRHTFKVDFPEDFPIIMGDETRLEQVISNLVSNAIKYAPEGEIRISGQARPDKVIVCVSDQGPGISPEDAPHIFDRFYRAPDMARQTKGAGLGLYLARSIVEAHGGRIWVDTEAGKGARICFSLPRE